MKKITIIFATLLINAFVFGQSPEKMSYQAIVRDTDNNLVVNSPIGMIVSIIQGTADGDVVYEEIYNPNPETNANGLVAIEIGTGLANVGSFATIDWTNGPYFIKTETDPTGGTSYTIIGTSQLLSVPYALHAKTADNIAGGLNETDPVFSASEAKNITTSDIANWNNKLETEIDGDVTNEIQDLTLNANILTITNNGIATNIDLSKYLDNVDTKLTETEVDEMTANNGYAMKDMGNEKIINLADPTEAQDAATKAYVDVLKQQLTQLQKTLEAGGLLEDIDGNKYNIVEIGNQVWMAENLKVTHYPNGTAIPLITDSTAWANLADNATDDAYCYYNNVSNSEYGALYTWAAAMGDNAVSSDANPSGEQGVCPDGWHLPSDVEWNELENFIAADGYSGQEGTALKATSGWYNDGNGTDIYSFNGLPGGKRYYSNGLFYYSVNYGRWWSSAEYSSAQAYSLHLYYYSAGVVRSNSNKSNGFSVRCLKD